MEYFTKTGGGGGYPSQPVLKRSSLVPLREHKLRQRLPSPRSLLHHLHLLRQRIRVADITQRPRSTNLKVFRDRKQLARLLFINAAHTMRMQPQRSRLQAKVRRRSTRIMQPIRIRLSIRSKCLFASRQNQYRSRLRPRLIELNQRVQNLRVGLIALLTDEKPPRLLIEARSSPRSGGKNLRKVRTRNRLVRKRPRAPALQNNIEDPRRNRARLHFIQINRHVLSCKFKLFWILTRTTGCTLNPASTSINLARN